MTRYARANGSRGSNVKQGEPSTSWKLLKNRHCKGDTRGKQEERGVKLNINTRSWCTREIDCIDQWFDFRGERTNELAAIVNETNLGNYIKQMKKMCGKVVKRDHPRDNTTNLQGKVKSFGREISIVAGEAAVSSDTVDVTGGSELSKSSSIADLGRSGKAKGGKFAITRNELKELRRKEKAHKREKKKVCFCCRRWGHQLMDCPEFKPLRSMEITLPAGGFCYQCGSTEHKVDQCTKQGTNNHKFARCFVCGEEGHLARQCLDNPKGAYPQGGTCRICGETTHLCSNCPKAAIKCPDPERKVACLTKGPVDSLPEDCSNLSSSFIISQKIIQF